MMRNFIKFVIAIFIVLSIYFFFSNRNSPSFGDSATPAEQTTYWVIVMYNPIGTKFISEVFPLPVDDKESISIAARGWGNERFMTSENSVYKFTSREQAEKFRQEKGGVALKLPADELKKYLCLGQSVPPSKEFWIIIAQDYEGNDFISKILHLPPYDKKIIEAAARNWGNTHGTVLFRIEESKIYSFNDQEGAEKFHQEKKLPDLDIRAESLQKYICVEKVRLSEANKLPKYIDKSNLNSSKQN